MRSVGERETEDETERNYHGERWGVPEREA